jgi:uncharacterized protein (TIGR02118 family)
MSTRYGAALSFELWSESMHKLVILIEEVENWRDFENLWPEFLHQAEEMPGLRREATSHVEEFIFGAKPVVQVHELFFDSLEAAQQAMVSPSGRAAGRLLQQMTRGNLTLFFAEHKEDELENIRKYKEGRADEGA